jgi:ariadne-1
VRCPLIRKWTKKCDDDSETSNWISANTKECPKCGATIEKDGGCNHMICKNQSCKEQPHKVFIIILTFQARDAYG